MRARRQSQAHRQRCLPDLSGPRGREGSSDFTLQTFERATFGVQRVIFDPDSLGRLEVYANQAYCRQAVCADWLPPLSPLSSLSRSLPSTRLPCSHFISSALLSLHFQTSLPPLPCPPMPKHNQGARARTHSGPNSPCPSLSLFLSPPHPFLPTAPPPPASLFPRLPPPSRPRVGPRYRAEEGRRQSRERERERERE